MEQIKISKNLKLQTDRLSYQEVYQEKRLEMNRIPSTVNTIAIYPQTKPAIAIP